MLTRVEAQNARGETLALPLGDFSGGYSLREITGLDPVQASLVSTRFAQMNGTVHQASRLEDRNIVLTLGYEPDWVTQTVRSLRQTLYGFFMPESEITLRFYEDDSYFAYISGRVETFETPLFTEEPEASISIICNDPVFIAPSSVVVSGLTVSDATERGVLYPGTIGTGFVFTINIDRNVSEVAILNRLPGGTLLTLEFQALLLAGDILTISTIPGQKRAVRTRNGVNASLLYGVSPSSSWIHLSHGINNLRIAVDGAPIPWTLEYRAKYGGL